MSTLLLIAGFLLLTLAAGIVYAARDIFGRWPDDDDQ